MKEKIIISVLIIFLIGLNSMSAQKDTIYGINLYSGPSEECPGEIAMRWDISVPIDDYFTIFIFGVDEQQNVVKIDSIPCFFDFSRIDAATAHNYKSLFIGFMDETKFIKSNEVDIPKLK